MNQARNHLFYQDQHDPLFRRTIMATPPPDPYAPDPALDPNGKPISDDDRPDTLPGPDNTHPDKDDAGDAPSDPPTQTQA